MFILLGTNLVNAQQTSTRYGKVTNDELNMTTYQPDTTANAVVIYCKGVTTYDYSSSVGFKLTTAFEKKIKILKPEGVSHADIEIPFYSNEKVTSDRENIVGLEAVAYNMVNGKMERTKMKSDYVFRERVSSNTMLVKFSIPAVKEGTVIEYKYKLISEHIGQLDPWDIQEDIPVMYSHYDIAVPEYFRFNLDVRGGIKIDSKEETIPMSISLGGGDQLRLNARNMIFTAKDVPAMKGDSYIWCPDDYLARVNFELHGVQWPNDIFRSFSTTWEKIDELLLDDENFGKMLKMRNPFRDEVNALAFTAETKVAEKTCAIYNLLKQKIAWNKNYGLFANDIKKSVKEGVANNANLNFILMSMLNDAGIKNVPIVMSRRNRGIIPYAHPSLSKINTFVVGIYDEEGNMFLLDGSVEHGFLNVLPPVLATNRARIVSKEAGNKWVEPDQLSTGQIRSMTSISFDEDGTMKGERITQYGRQQAASYRGRYAAAKDSTEFVEKIETEEAIKITAFTQEKLKDFAPDLTEKLTFEKEVEVNGDYIYFNPLIFKHISKNPFVQETRQMPVEFASLESLKLMISITIPDGYQVEELPKGEANSLPDGKASYRYLLQQQGNKITINYQFNMVKKFYTIQEYKELREFFAKMVAKNNETMVLKKTTE